MANAKQTKTITTLATFTAADQFLDYLAYAGKKVELIFNVTTLPTTLEVGIVNQGGTFLAKSDGAITSTGVSSFVINAIPPQGIAIKSTGGTANFTVDFGGYAGPLGS